MIRPIKLTDNPLDPAAHRRAIKEALQAEAALVQADFEKTTATWDSAPSFDISADGEFGVVIGTDDENYQRVDEGTRPHVIVAKGKALAFTPGGSAKTRPRVIGSSGGSKGSGVVFTKRVNHPGTEGRDFSGVIAEKAGADLEAQVQIRLNRVAG